MQHTNDSLQQQIEKLQLQLSKKNRRKSNPPQVPSPMPRGPQVRMKQVQEDHSVKAQPSKQHVHLHQLQPSVRQSLRESLWIDRGRAPNDMARGAAVVDGNMAYFMSWDGQTCSYNSSTQKWKQLPMCPCVFSGLAVVRGYLTAIGGRKGSAILNELLALRVNLVVMDQKWVGYFPPMPTKRSHTAAVTTIQHLIVAGGENGSNRLDTVEVLDIETLVWSTAASLPHPYSYASATICGDQLYILGEHEKVAFGSSREPQVVLASSLTQLLHSCHETLSNSVWHGIADIPVYRSTCATINGELIAVGGLDAKFNTTSAVRKYNPTTDSWDIITSMPTARYRCLVAVLPANEMMVVGGMINVYDCDPLIIGEVETMFY